MKRVFALLVTALPLAACQSGQGSYWQSMQQYQGASEAQLIDALGPPDNHYTVEGVKYLTYSRVRQYDRDSSGIGIGTGTYGHGGGVWASQRLGGSGSVQVFRCDVTFKIRNRVVENIGRRGNDC